MMKLHSDWPEFDGFGGHSWELPEPYGDIASAFEDYPTFATASSPSSRAEAFGPEAITSVTEYYIASGGIEWKPGDYLGTELEMVLVGTLTDGRWFTLSGWNDYTGWGCQSGADVRVGATREQVVANGLDDRERELLGVTLDA